jgi:SNF2 family DNA or RNA helicase
MRKYSDLTDYQLKAVEFIKTKGRVALHLKMGRGKTVITLTAISELLKIPLIKKVLVIAPLRVANNVWHAEIEEWEHLKHLKYSIVTGSEKERLNALKVDADIYICNRENVVWLYEAGYSKFGMIVLDESTSFKNSKSQRFKYLKKFQYHWMVQLTGTPAPNGLKDLWSQIYLLDGGESLGKSMWSFENTFFYSDYMGYNLTPKSPKLIFEKIDHLVYSLGSNEDVSLPSLTKLKTFINIPNFKKYKSLEKEFFLKVNDNAIVASTKAVLGNKLLQYCNGAVYDADKNVIETHTAKLDALEDLIEDNANENILVAYNYKSDLERLLARFKQAELINDANIAKWNKGEIKLMLCHPASAGRGLNLQFGGNIIIWFGLTWNLEDYLQFNARLYRPGQTKGVVINHIVAKDCIDEKILDALAAKNISQNNLLDYLKTNVTN